MGADKNSSLKSRTQLCLKVTHKDSHTNLSRSRSHNGHTNPRNNPNTTQSRSTTQEAKDLANLRSHWRAVRNVRAEGPRVVNRQSEG
jgi:hypothetical protein